jgi:uncharacterized SAM-binding protein YcdF (DUF218 family)
VLFWLSKTFWIVIAPSNLALIAAVVGAILLWTRWRAMGRWLVSLGIVVLVALAVLPIGAWLGWPLENRFATPDPMPTQVDGIILLGGASNVSQTRARGFVSVNEAADRMIAFVDLAQRYPDARLAYTGGTGSLRPEAMREADVARMALRTMGLDVDRVVFERESRNTFENAQNLKPLIEPKAGETWLLIMSALNMPRAAGVFRAADWPVIPYPVDHAYGVEPPGVSLDWDLAGRANSAQRVLREWIGLVVYRVLGRTDALFPEPT